MYCKYGPGCVREDCTGCEVLVDHYQNEDLPRERRVWLWLLNRFNRYMPEWMEDWCEYRIFRYQQQPGV